MMNYFKDYSVIEGINSGGSPVEKYLLFKDDKYYLLRLFDPRFMSSRIDALENTKQLYLAGVNVPNVYEYGLLDDGRKGYAILEWLIGTPLDKILTGSNEKNYGELIAAELVKLHSVKTNNSMNIYLKYLSSTSKKIEKLHSLGIDNKVFSLLQQYIDLNSPILKDRFSSIIHGDFHPGNILLTNERKLSFVDMDMCSGHDPWIDLASNSCNLEHLSFYSSLITHYFNSNIPDNFWKVYNLYGILYCLDYLIYTMRIEKLSIEDGFDRLTKFLNTNNSLTKEEPDWFKNRILLKEKI